MRGTEGRRGETSGLRRKRSFLIIRTGPVMRPPASPWAQLATPAGLKPSGSLSGARACLRLRPSWLRTLTAQGERYIEAGDLAALLGKKATGGHWNSGIETDGYRYRTAALFRT